jgi:fermentation-respiration switch protein FrsA (DUF1100 family)
MGSYLSRPINAVVAVVPVVASLMVLGLYKFQTSLIYPSQYPEGSRTIVDTPASYDIPFEDITIETVDGEKLKAYVMLHDRDSSPRKTVLMLDPNAGNMGHYLGIANLFYTHMNYNVVTFSYRGYGLSTGTPSEAGIKTDASAMLDYLHKHPLISQTSLVLYGRSLGGAVAIYMSQLPKGMEMVKGLILENTFLSILKVIPNVFPLLSQLTFLCSEKWRSEDIIGKIPSTIPMLFLGGAQDELVPPDHPRRLYELSKSSNKVFKAFPRGTHNDTSAQPDYWEEVHAFIHDTVEPAEVRR